MLRKRIEYIRKNPKAYRKKHEYVLKGPLNKIPLDDLICLIFACTSYEEVNVFQMILNEIEKRNIEADDHLRLHYLYVAQGLHKRSILMGTDALHFFTRAYDQAILTQDMEIITRTLIYISSAFHLNEDLPAAFEYARKALRLTTHLQTSSLVADVYMHLGLMHSKRNEFHEALKRYHFAEATYNQLPDKNDHLNYIILLSNIGRAYLEIGEPSLTEKYFEKSLEAIYANDFVPYVQGTIKYISEYYHQKNDLLRANEILIRFFDYHLIAIREAEKNRFLKNKNTLISSLQSLDELEKTNQRLNKEVESLKLSLLSEKPQDVVDDRIKDIEKAFKNDEFIPYVQAKWETKSLVITGAEVLARWKKPSGEIWGPYHFIEDIENTPLIFDFTENLIRKTLKMISPYIRERDPLFKVCLNVSPFQLANQNLVDLLESFCVEFGIWPHNFEIEVIERTFLENDRFAIKQLQEIKNKGFQIALDDFGSGYSSLACIVDLPLDVVKIDRTLVKDMTLNHRALQLFKSITQMLHSLHLNVIVEGIETEEQLNYVKAAQCEEAQGFFIHKPEPLDLFLKRIQG